MIRSIYLHLFCLIFSSLFAYDEAYVRAPDFEVKSFIFPSLDVYAPEIEVPKIEEQFSPFHAFLKNQQTPFFYANQHNLISFDSLFSFFFSYKAPSPNISSIEISLLPICPYVDPLQEGAFSYSTPRFVGLLALSPPRYFTDYKNPVFLSRVDWACVSEAQPFFPLNKASLLHILYSYLPTLEVNVLETLPSWQKTSDPLPNDFNPYAITKKLHFKEPISLSPLRKASFSPFSVDPLITSYIESDKITQSKTTCPLASHLNYPTFAKQELAIVHSYLDSPQIMISALKEFIETPTIARSILPELNCSHLIALSHVPNWKYTTLHYSYIKSSQLEMPQSSILLTTLTFPKTSLKVAPISLPTKAPPSSLPRSIETQFSISSTSITAVLDLPTHQFQGRYLQYSLKPPTYISAYLPRLKHSFLFNTHLTVPELMPPSLTLKPSQQLARYKPTKNSHAPLTLAQKEPSLDLAKHSSTFLTHSLKTSTLPLQNIDQTVRDKPTLFATLCSWSPGKNAPAFCLKDKLPAPPTYRWSKEGTLPHTIEKGELTIFASRGRRAFTPQLFNLAISSPKMVEVTKLPLSGKNFLPYFVTSEHLDTLLALHPPIHSESPLLAMCHTSINSFLQENVSEEAYTQFLGTHSTLAFPKSISHRINLPNTASEETLVSNAFIQSMRGYIPSKEGVFPEKEFLRTNTLNSFADLVPSPKVTLPYSKTEANKIDTAISVASPLLSPDIISLLPLATNFMPPIRYEELVLALQNIREFSSFAFTREEALHTDRKNRTTLQYLAELPSLELLQTYSFSDDFKIDVHVLPKMTKDGYAFSLQLSPYNHDLINPLPAHVYFVLDRSSSIESHRFKAFKQGLVGAISQLHESATFNVITFDQEYEKLSPEDLRPTKSAAQFVKKSLEKVGQKWNSSFSALLSLLQELQTQAITTGEPHTVIILSDGHFLKNIRLHRESLYQLFHIPTDNFSLFTTAISDNNNIFMLDLFAKLGRGEFLHSQTHNAFPRKLAVLVKRLQKPLATDLTIHLADPHKHISFSHDPKSAPLLYSDKLYHIYGQADTLQDAKLIIQGKAGDKWINIVKKIDLSKAERKKTIDKELSSKEALSHIMNFIFTNNQNDLLVAKELISPFDIKWSLN